MLLTLLNEVQRARPEWRLSVIAGDTGPLLDAVRALGCHAECLPMPGVLKALGDWGVTGKLGLVRQLALAMPAIFRYRATLRRILRGLAPSVVQTNGFKMHLLGALARPGTVSLIWHVHDFVSNRAAMKTLLRRLSRRPVAIVAISDSVNTDLRQVVLIPGKVRTIWNSVALQPYLDPAASDSSEIRIGLVATFARWKGHEVFLSALAKLPRDFPWRAFIVGGEVYSRSSSQYSECELREKVADLRLQERIEFTGFLADPAPFVRSLDIVVHASTEPEPFGLAIAEGMAAARAVVTSSDSLITHGVNGFVFASGDAAALARALEELARDPALRVRLGTAARATAEQRFQPERMAREFIELYEAVA